MHSQFSQSPHYVRLCADKCNFGGGGRGGGVGTIRLINFMKSELFCSSAFVWERASWWSALSTCIILSLSSHARKRVVLLAWTFHQDNDRVLWHDNIHGSRCCQTELHVLCVKAEHLAWRESPDWSLYLATLQHYLHTLSMVQLTVSALWWTTCLKHWAVAGWLRQEVGYNNAQLWGM